MKSVFMSAHVHMWGGGMRVCELLSFLLQDNLSLVSDTLMESREISPPPLSLIPLPTYEEAIMAPPEVDEANQR